MTWNIGRHEFGLHFTCRWQLFGQKNLATPLVARVTDATASPHTLKIWNETETKQFQNDIHGYTFPSINRIGIFNVAKIARVITKSTKRNRSIWIVKAKCLVMIGETGMSLVCGRKRSRRRMTEYQERGWSRGKCGVTPLCLLRFGASKASIRSSPF